MKTTMPKVSTRRDIRRRTRGGLASWEKLLLSNRDALAKTTHTRARQAKRLEWRHTITAAARREGMTYNQFMSGLHRIGVNKDRRWLAELTTNPEVFANTVDEVRRAAARES